MALTLTAAVNSVAADCSYINFSDTTSNYGSGTNPAYTDVQSVVFQLFDSTGTTLLGTYANSGWTPYPSNAINLFAVEFGVGLNFANGNYLIKYTITLNDGVTTYTCSSNTFNVQCGASLCNTTLTHILLANMSAVTYPASLTTFKIAGTTYTHTISGIASLADMATKLNAYLATLTGLPQNVAYTQYVVNGTTLEVQNPYFTTLTDYNVVVGGNTYVGNSNNNTQNQVAQDTHISYSCTTKVASVTNGSTNWTGTAFPNLADINTTITFNLYQVGNGTPIATATMNVAQFTTYLSAGTTLAALFPSTTLTPCVEYNLVPSIPLSNGDTINCDNTYFTLSFCNDLKQSGLVVTAELAVNKNCAEMVLCDTTGMYDAVRNVGGYGTPNPNYADVARTEFLIGLPDGTTRVIESEFLPTEYGSNCVAFSVTDLYGSTTTYTTIPDFVYPITYNVYGQCDQLLGSYSFNAFFACNLKACLDQRSQDTSGCTNCDEDEIQSILLGYADYMRMSAVAVTQPQCANTQLQQAYKQCITKCSTCAENL